MRFLIVFFLSFCFTASFAQLNETRAKKHYKQAYLHYGYGEYDKTIELLNEALEDDSTHMPSLYLLSDVYNLQRDTAGEMQVYRSILKLDDEDLKANFNIADLFLKNGAYSRAINAYESLKLADWVPERYDKLIDKNLAKARTGLELKSKPVPFEPERLDDRINTKEDEYWPYLSPDGREIYFTRTQSTTNNKQIFSEENIFYGELNSRKEPVKLPYPINTAENDGAQCITQDGSAMFFAACNQGGRGDCNLYVCYRYKGKWTNPRKLPSPVNSRFKESQPSISYDGTTLFFSSDRPGGVGGLDIWVTQMRPDSQWAVPRNLGSLVNTPLNEESPFIHLDNKTLYFSSNGHDGLGSGDLFMVRLEKGAKVKNLGYPINDHRKQLGIFVGLDGKTGYFASLTDMEYGLDIYRFALPPEIQPIPLHRVRGLVRDSITQKPIAARLEVHDLSTGERIIQYLTKADGHFEFGLPTGKFFSVRCVQPGYLPFSMHIAASDSVEHFYTLDLRRIEPDARFVLRNLFFDFDKDSLKAESMPELLFLAEYLQEHPAMIIEIGGHTDNKGSDSYNLDLSERRALAVYNALNELIEGDISERVKVRGYGSSQPVASNSTDLGRSKNRRTEIKILEVN